MFEMFDASIYNWESKSSTDQAWDKIWSIIMKEFSNSKNSPKKEGAKSVNFGISNPVMEFTNHRLNKEWFYLSQKDFWFGQWAYSKEWQ